jgi:endoribonuclease Dicer
VNVKCSNQISQDASVNNAFLSNVAAFAGLHALLHHFSSPLQDAIAAYCKALFIAKRRDDIKKSKAQSSSTDKSTDTTKTRQSNSFYWEEVDPPKCVSDIFEAMLGAIFVDSGFDIEVVWSSMQVIWLPWVKNYINEESVGRHPLREMASKFSMMGCSSWRVPTYANAETGTFIAHIVLHDERIVISEGVSRKDARRIAAEECLTKLEEDFDAFKTKCSCKGILLETGVLKGDDVQKMGQTGVKIIEKVQK